MTRSKVRSELPRGCGPVAEWCLWADVAPTTRNRYEIWSTMCVNTKSAVGALDFATTQEADFELLAGTQVIWRWSDTQTFQRQAHAISAIAGECFTWLTSWDQYDGRGHRVGKARLTLRVRSLADQRPNPPTASIAFFTTA